MKAKVSPTLRALMENRHTRDQVYKAVFGHIPTPITIELKQHNTMKKYQLNIL